MSRDALAEVFVATYIYIVFSAHTSPTPSCSPRTPEFILHLRASPSTFYIHADEYKLNHCTEISRRTLNRMYTTSVSAATKQRDSPWTAYHECICHHG